MHTLAQKISACSTSFSYQDLPREVIHEVKRRVLDTLGCAFGAFNTPPARAARGMVRDFASGGGATLIGTRQKTSPDFAAFGNGILFRYLDYNDTYLSLEPAHPSDNIAAALALSELLDRDGKALIGAIALGYEIHCRLCDAASLRSRGWDHVLYVSMASSILSSWLLALNGEKTAQALSLAITPNNTLRQTRVGNISMWKGCAAANASRNGLFSALIAAHGITGPAPVFEGERGLFSLVTGPFSLNISEFAKERQCHKILETYIKFYPVEYHSQAAVEAALILRKKISLDEIDNIKIKTYDACVDIIAGDKEKWRPKTRETADHSLPYCVAVALTDGVVGLEQFSEERLQDLSLCELMDKISVERNNSYSEMYPRQFPCQIDISLKSGRLISETVLFPKGHPENRMSDKEVENKFHTLAEPLLGEAERKLIIERVRDLEQESSVRSFLKSLAVQNRDGS